MSNAIKCISWVYLWLRFLYLEKVHLYFLEGWNWNFILFYFNIFIDYAITVVPFPPFTPLHPAHPLPATFPPYSSCPWVILISSLASTSPTLFLPSPCLFSTYHLFYLFSVPSPPLLLPYRQPSGSSCLPCLLSFLFYVWSLITVSLLSFLLFIFFIFFFLDKSL